MRPTGQESEGGHLGARKPTGQEIAQEVACSWLLGAWVALVSEQ